MERDLNDVPVKSVQKALMLLDRIALGDTRREGVPLSALAEEFGWPLNSTYNLVKTLVSCGYVAQIARGVYSAGAKCGQMRRAAQCADRVTLDRLLSKMQEFVDAEGEACVCAVLSQGCRAVVGRIESNHAVRVSHATVEDTPFFARATGRMLAATADAAELKLILERNGMPGKEWDAITDSNALAEKLAALRAQGWCLMEGKEQDLVAMAAPILENDARAWGVLGTFAPSYRCPPERQKKLIRTLCHFAGEISGIVS